MKVILFGGNGMLGNYVNIYLSSYYNVFSINRNKFDIESTNWDKLYNILESIVKEGDIVINCAGAIPQQNIINTKKYIILNTLFPNKLHDYSKLLKYKFIHISTDCVFSGKRGKYDEDDEHDTDNIYGISKSLGENNESTIIRTSIIGEEVYNKNSFIEWLKKNKNLTVNGYKNVYWNGITCYQLSKILKYMIVNNIFWQGVRHIYSPNIISKYELCTFVNNIYKLNINIKQHYSIVKNMSIISKYNENNIFNIPDIMIQIQEQFDYNILQYCNNNIGLFDIF